MIKKNTEFGYIALALNMFYGAHKKNLESDCDSTTMRRKKRNQQTKSDILRVFHGRINAKKGSFVLLKEATMDATSWKVKTPQNHIWKKNPSKFQEKIRPKKSVGGTIDGKCMSLFQCAKSVLFMLYCVRN